MKKITLLFAFTICFALASNAQDREYSAFKFGFGFGYAIPSGGGGGILFYAEPAYRVSDKIAIGLKWESVLRASVSTSGTSVGALGSYTVNGQYYLSNNKFRPFVGAGIGLFTGGGASVDMTGISIDISGNVIGFYPRVGFDLGHLNMMLEYNIVPNDNSYLGVKLGFVIGGGAF